MFVKISNQNLQILIIWGFILFCPILLMAQEYIGSPVTKIRLLKTIQSRQLAVPIIVKTIKERGVDFKLTPEVEQEFLAIKINRQIIAAAKDHFRTPKVETSNKIASPAKKTGSLNQKVPLTNTELADTTEKYEQLYYQGLQMIDQLRGATSRQQADNIAKSMTNIGLQAIKLDPSRPDAYKVVGSALLLTGKFEEAEKYGQEAINRGASLAFPVYHLSGTPHLEFLHIGKGFITIESDQKFFEYNTREIINIEPQDNYNLPNGSVAVFSISAFKNNTSANWFFSPGNTGSVQEANLILRLIQRNAMAGR